MEDRAAGATPGVQGTLIKGVPLHHKVVFLNSLVLQEEAEAVGRHQVVAVVAVGVVFRVEAEAEAFPHGDISCLHRA